MLGPLLFTIYTLPIVSVIALFRNVHHAHYADNTQLDIALSTDKALSVINNCFQSIHCWLDANGLCLTTYARQLVFTFGLYFTSAGVCQLMTVATALMSSRLDYCNSILYSTSSSNLNKLQRVQNALACTLYRHDVQKTRSYHTGVSPSSLAPCYCQHSVQNRTADIQDTHYPSAELHTRPTPVAVLVATTQVRQSQPA